MDVRATRILRIRERIKAVIWGLVLLLAAIFPMNISGAETGQEQKTVRVGYVNVATYEEGGEGEYKRGSGYEYLQKISYYTGWKYEYVYGSFKECYDMLVNGDIDLFGNVSYKPERAELFDFSSYPQGKDTYLLDTTKEHTSVTDEVLDITNGFLIDRDLTFTVIRAKPENPYVLADAVRIREVLVNILSNAVKFTNDGGSIRFETDYRPGADERHIIVHYRVTDTGVGMSEEFVKHVFEEFVQEDNGARTQYKGTGLGMAISKQYVELMGGTISVESRKGIGSTFTVELPMELTDAETVGKQVMPNANTNLTGVKVLMAEDNDLNAEIAIIQLEECGMQVTLAVDGKQVVEVFADSPEGTFDVILMDIMMPQMNGYEATRAIRNLADRPDGRTIPIIAMTANAFAEDVQASMDAGMNAHLAKPLQMDEVVKTIAGNLNK